MKSLSDFGAATKKQLLTGQKSKRNTVLTGFMKGRPTPTMKVRNLTLAKRRRERFKK